MYDPISAVATALPFVGNIASSIIGADSSRKAANAQIDAANAATNAQLQMTAPWREAGQWALNQLQPRISAGPGSFTASPGYQFRLGEGVNALQRGAAAKGNLLSGATQKALTRYGQDYGSNEYQNWLNQWYQSLTPYQSMANQGQTATTSILPNMNANALFGGESKAAGIMGQGNTWSNLFQWGGNQGGNMLMGNPMGNMGNVYSSIPWRDTYDLTNANVMSNGYYA